MKDVYKRGSCNFYDELATLAVLRKNCDIVFWDENDVKAIIYDSIKNIFSANNTEYLETGKGIKIRLGRLIEVDGKKPNNRC